MSPKIPFLEMFSLLQRDTELVNAAGGWVILNAAIDKEHRSAVVTVDGAQGAGGNLLEEVQQSICSRYKLNSVKIQQM